MFRDEYRIHSRICIFLLIACTMSAVVSMVIPISDKTIHKMFMHRNVSKMGKKENEQIRRNQNLVDGAEPNSLRESGSQEKHIITLKQKNVLTDYIKSVIPRFSVYLNIVFRIFCSENRIEIQKRRETHTDDNAKKITKVHNRQLEIMDGALNILSQKKQTFTAVTHLTERRSRRDVGFNSSRSKPNSRHHFKSRLNQTKTKQWTHMNMTFIRQMVHKITLQTEIKRSAQVAFLCISSLCFLMTWAVWYNGMCRNRNSKYTYWDRRATVTTDIKDILYRRRKHLPMFRDEYVDVVYVKDKGTDP